MAYGYDCLFPGAADLTARRFVDEGEEVAGLAAEHLAHFLQGLEIDSERFPFLKTPKRRVADAGFLSQPIKGASLRRQ